MEEKRGLDKWDGLAIGLILLAGILLWGQPINELPFGDVDSSTHFTLGDYMGQTNKPIYKLPSYINFDYGMAADGNIWYPPQFAMIEAIMQLTNNQRVLPIFFFYLLCGLAIIPTTYLLIKYLFGRLPAILSGLLLLVSFRDYTTYLWGLWPEKISFAFVPLILYFYYRFTEGKEGKYLVFTALLAGVQFLLHPQGLVHSAVIIFFFTLFLLIKNKRLPFTLTQLVIPALLFAIVVAPFMSGALGFGKNVMMESYGDSFRIQELSSLVKWYPAVPYTPQFADFEFVYYSYWPLLFLILGSLAVLFKRDNSKFLISAYFISLYVLMHLNVIGITGRVHRSLNAEAHLFLPLMVIGLVWVCTLIKRPKLKNFKIAMLVVIAALFSWYFVTGFKAANAVLPTAYDNIMRINQYEVDACDWIRVNTPEDSNILLNGVLVYSNRKWIQAMCLRHIIYDDQTIFGINSTFYGTENYLMLDRSDAVLFGQKQAADFLLNMSLSFRQQAKPIYDNGLVEVYYVK